MYMKRIIFITILILCSVSLMLGQSKFSLGEAAMKKGNYDQAITYFTEAKKAAKDAGTVSLCNKKIAECNRKLRAEDRKLKEKEQAKKESEQKTAKEKEKVEIAERELDNWKQARTTPKEEIKDTEEWIPFAIVEDKPLFLGGDANKFTEWVYNNLEYPEIAKKNGIQGRVTVSFSIDEDGCVKDVRVLRGVDSSLDNEVVRVVQNSPRWSPGKQRNKPVKVRYTFPINFKLK